MAAPSATMSTFPKLRIGAPMSMPASELVAELQSVGARPKDRQARLRPAVAAEGHCPLVRQILHEERTAPGLALEADAEVRRLVGVLGVDTGLADHGFE